MKNLLRFLFKYHATILFLGLELLALILVIRFNSFQKAKAITLKNEITGRLAQKYDNVASYFSLVKENEILLKENTELYNMLPDSYFDPMKPYKLNDISEKQFVFINAKVVNNSTNKRYNFITINKGSNDGIEPDMGVVNYEGIVGVVKATSPHFSSVVSVLNKNYFPPAKLKKSNYDGIIEWTGNNHHTVVLKNIPLHADISEGDTVVTSGFSSIFPRGIMIGTVGEYGSEEGAFITAKVNLSTDFKKLNHVMVIENRYQKERMELEEEVAND